MYRSTLAISWRRLLGATLLLAVPLLASAQQTIDPPGRIAYFSALEGSARIAGAGNAAWAPATLNWPVTTGTRLATEAGSRTELHGGWTALRLQGRSSLDVTRLDDDTLQVALTEGTLSARVRELQPGERVEIDTPQLAVVADQPGEYRIDVDPRADTTRVTVHSGSATVYGEAGQSSTVGTRQQIVFFGRALGVAQSGQLAWRDGFDQWVAARDALEDQSRSARYVSRDMPGYQQLDAYGEWAQDPSYGSVWYPSITISDWAPYRYGHWAWIEPWGWTWVDDAPWGFAPSHYGRWAQIGPRWAWVPGPLAPRPVYAPALVAFVGGGSGSTSWGISLGSGLAGAAWFPLAPGEYWEPYYHASPRYRRRLNHWGDARDRARPPADSFYFQRRPHAITVAPHDQFDGGDRRSRRPRYGDGSRLPAGVIDGGRVIAPPPRAFVPGLSTQAPLPTPRRDGQGVTEPRPDRGHRPGADWRQPGPRPDGWRQPGEHGWTPERNRPDQMERVRPPSRQPLSELPQMQEPQQRQLQLQRQQEERVRQLRQMPMPEAQPTTPMPPPRMQAPPRPAAIERLQISPPRVESPPMPAPAPRARPGPFFERDNAMPQPRQPSVRPGMSTRERSELFRP
ncbi:DUF6600 domain-containing protein [Ottowia sp.]|uniref:DUF6600 domain-containing protein n=1 Tax=Ottowia sp. TaxID=1898956 RepID=UPI002CE9A515|nr:DUF6600 domain-containing protein [Ottowia sp.]HRN75221.1 chromosome partitioning protein ParA [Ottowia sp.]HRQ01670.1 chromosome partitioning protein ParA [Ottowia sp.]